MYTKTLLSRALESWLAGQQTSAERPLVTPRK
jgi:hypothetical protein